MTATHAPFLLYAGDTWDIDAALHDSAGAPLDLTGAVVVWRLRDAGRNVVASLSVGSGITITDAVNGLCHITLPAPQTTKLIPGSYADETAVTLPSGVVNTQAVGLITVLLAGQAVGQGLAVQLQLLKAARATGQRRVRLENYEVEYKSDSEMAAAIASMENEIARTQGPKPVRNISVRTKGWY